MSAKQNWDELLSDIKRREIIDYSMVPGYAAASCAAIALGFFIPGKIGDVSLLFLQVGFIIFGAVFVITTTVLTIMQYNWDSQIHETNVNIARKRNDIPLMHELTAHMQMPEPPLAPVDVSTPTPEPSSQRLIAKISPTQYTISEPVCVPKADLIYWMFDTATTSKVRRIKTVRDFQAKFPNDPEVRNELIELESRGVIRKLWASENDNAARGIAEDVTLEEAYSVCGYDPLTVVVSPALLRYPSVSSTLDYTAHDDTHTKQAYKLVK